MVNEKPVVTITQQDDPGSYCAFSVQLTDNLKIGSLHRSLAEARIEAESICEQFGATLVEVLK